MSEVAGVQIKRNVILDEWRVSPAFDDLETEWEHAACCAEAHRPEKAPSFEPLPFDPDEWWPESCVA